MTAKFILTLGLALSAAACENLPGTGDWKDATAPSQTGGRTILTVWNRGNDRMTSVYIADCNATSWGSNKLSSNDYIFADGRHFFDVAPNCYDVMGRWGTQQSKPVRVIVKAGQGSLATLVP